jgi:hypothetical protein
MKNNRKVALAFLSIFLLFLGACQEGPKKDEPRNSEPPQEEKVTPPEGIISLEESKSLYDNYTKNRVDMIQQYEAERSPDEAFIPARLTAFTYADIKQYMAYVEQEAKEAGVKIESLRFYFANYPDQERFPDGKKIVHPRQNSIFVVPTTMMDGEEYGFYIDADGKAKPIKNLVGESSIGSMDKGNTSKASMVPTLFQKDVTSLNLNHGNSNPPPFTDFQ